MKNKYFYLSIIFSVVMTTVAIISCKSDSKESCLQDEICDVSVTACCDDNEVCTYKYNGKEYAEDDYDQLLKDMGCATSSMGRVTDNNDLVLKLKGLISKVRKEMN
jgi:hypothetical protein